MDSRLQDWINGLAGHSGLADSLMKIGADDLVYLVVPLLLLLWFWPGGERALNQRLAGAVVIGIVLSKVFEIGLGEVHQVARPFVSDPDTRLLITHGADNSFPSGHTSFAFGVAGTVVWWRQRLGAVALVCAAFVGFARVYVGVHWPVDIVVGAFVGLVAGAIAAWSVPPLVAPQRWLGRLLPPLLLSPP